MKYIWINPVTDSMYEEKELNRFLTEHGYSRIEVKSDWANVVREKYRLEVMNSSLPVMDVRCPKIKEILEEVERKGELNIPEISPILIHCGVECSKMEENGEKIITTPCQSLADMGNSLELDNTKFMTWNSFLESVGTEISEKKLKKSPIPPGFFDTLGINTVSVTGETEVKDYLRRGIAKEVQLVEMLFCEEGCHNGDGVRTDTI